MNWQPSRILSEIPRVAKRLHYYGRSLTHHLTPYGICRKSTENMLRSMKSHPDYEQMQARVDYYNKLDANFDASAAPKISDVDKSQSRYFIDLDEHMRGFGPDRRLFYLYGDIVTVLDVPTIVKSRPISDDNHNSILIKLDKFRHFSWSADPVPFRDKKPMAVWRGLAHTNPRRILIKKFYDHPLCDIGHVGGKAPGFAPKPRLSHAEQKQFKFFLSIEGIDVATNLKWSMASNMLVMSPALEFETWFMEGALEPNKHFVLLKDDFSDLEEKIAYYTEHTDEAEAIIDNAHQWIAQFEDPLKERMIGAAVMQKYFELSGQSA